MSPLQGANNTFSMIRYDTPVGCFLADYRADTAGKTAICLIKILSHMYNKTSHPFSFPPSVQSDLFNYLDPQQQEAIRPYLRLLKHEHQEKLCVSLLDYLEGHGLEPLDQPVLCMLQDHIIQSCNIHPLTFRQPKSIGTIVKQLFPTL